jgi:hypothetical protein
MGIDSSYGSGKPRSAASSAARRRVASRKLTKSKGFREQANARSLRTTGKPVSTQMLESGVGGYTMIAASILKSAARMLKPAAETALERAAKITAAKGAQFNAAIFKTAARTPAARGAVDKSVRNSVDNSYRGFYDKTLEGWDPSLVKKATNDVMRLGDEMSDAFRLQSRAIKPREYDVAQRGIAKILGQAGRVDPAYRQIGRDFRIASRKTFRSNLGRKIK